MGIGSLGHWACSCKKTRAPLYHRANQPWSAENNSPSQPSHPHMGRSLRNPQRLLDKSQTRRLGLWFQASVRVSVVIVRRYCLSDLDSVIVHLPFVDAARYYLFCTWVSALYHRPAPVVLWPPVRLTDETCLAHSSPIHLTLDSFRPSGSLTHILV